MNNKIRTIIAIALVLGVTTSPVYAGEYNALRKFSRGFVNVLGGIVEVPRQVIKVTEKSGDIAGISYGLLKGFACWIGRTMVGVYEVGTFIFPSYRPLIEPEFIFEEEEEIKYF